VTVVNVLGRAGAEVDTMATVLRLSDNPIDPHKD
jgi:hypothetical protein